MKNKIFLICIFVSLIFILFLLSKQSYGQMENDPTSIMSELLIQEDVHGFLINQEDSNVFASNFRLIDRLEPSERDIFIKPGSELIIDGEQLPEFSTILLEGTLRIYATDESPLRVQKIIVAPTGRLIIGDELKPIEVKKKAEIVFIKNQPGEIGIFVFGQLLIHGHDIENSFVELVGNVGAGGEVVVLNQLVKQWPKDGKIIITSTGLAEAERTCTEEAEILKIEGIFIHLKNPLACFHRGAYDNNVYPIRSHVALLDRNVKFTSADENNRGFIKYFHGSSGYIKYAEFDKLGQKNVPGGYPIHFHRMKDTSRGIQVIGNSITNSDNRWITIHDSNGVLVKDNVGYRSVGHGFFLEEGLEFDNIFEHNIGIITLPGKLIKSDPRASVFWTLNPQNVFRNNVAVEGFYYGFHLVVPNKIVSIAKFGNDVNLSSLPNLDFDSNIAYNNRRAGMKIDRITLMDERIGSPAILISNFTSWNRASETLEHDGIRIRANDVIVSDSTIIGGHVGIELLGDRNLILRTRVIGHLYEEIFPLIAGIRIAGQDNVIQSSLIEGYYSVGNHSSYDIAVSNNPDETGLTTASIIRTRLQDRQPLFFGHPSDLDSYIQVFDYDAPNGPNKEYPKDFVLKRMDYSYPEDVKKEPLIDENFVALIQPWDVLVEKHITSKNSEIQEYNEAGVYNMINYFKNMARLWNSNIIGNDEFSDSVRILLESKIIHFPRSYPNNFESYNLEVPIWFRFVTNLWIENKISYDELANALSYIMKLQMGNVYKPYN